MPFQPASDEPFECLICGLFLQFSTGACGGVAPQEIPGEFSLEKDRLVFKGKMETYSS